MEKVDHSMLKLAIDNIQPNVRHANLLQCTPGFNTQKRKIYDHQFIYVHSGKGQLTINDKTYPALPGDLFFYGPGISHCIVADTHEPFLITGIHFDFTQNHKDKCYPMGPFQSDLFDPALITEIITFNDFPGFPEHIHLPSNNKVRDFALEIVNEFESKKRYHQYYIDGIFLSWSVLVMRHISLKDAGFKDNHIVNELIEHLRINYNKNISHKSISEQFHFHPVYLNELMNANTGMSLKQYIIDLRIRKAVDLILNSNTTISQISREVGYENPHYFSRIFKQKTGYPPSLLRAQCE